MKNSFFVLSVLFLPFMAGEFINLNRNNIVEDNNWEWDDVLNDLAQPSAIVSSNETSAENVAIKCATTPSHKCQLIVERFGWAISNYTLCSVKNARPIHLCENCVQKYLDVRAAHDKFEATIDYEGNNCKDYFLNLDRLQIVSEAYRYVHHLWRKANCNSCFKNDVNGTMTSNPTDATIKFSKFYNQTHDCFRSHRADNLTCTDCLDLYKSLTDAYIEIQDNCGDEVCMDIVDSMNITRFLYNKKGCVRRQGVSVGIMVGLGLIALSPVTFYTLAYLLSNKQESKIIQQKRLAEIFAVNTTSGNFIPDHRAHGSSAGATRARRFDDIFRNRQRL